MEQKKDNFDNTKKKYYNKKENKKEDTNNHSGLIFLGLILVAFAIILSFNRVSISILDPQSMEDITLETITLTHQEALTHDGVAYAARFSGIVVNGDTRYGIVKSDGREVHFFARRINVIDLDNQVIDFEFKIYENVVVATNGTPITTLNLDRGSNNQSTALLFADPTGIDLTNAIWLESVGNRIKAERKSSTVTSEALEYIMKEDTYYLIEFINYGTGDIEVQYDLLWGEVEK